jgi:hypothetical protein
MMEKEFVTYELALRLKALGFDEPCLAYWDNHKLFIIDRNSERIQKNSNYKDIFEGIISAPTYSQAFRWFREKYDLHHVIHQFTFKKGTDEEYLAEVAKADDTFSECRTYEDAEVACLEKLIEIIEEKQK